MRKLLFAILSASPIWFCPALEAADHSPTVLAPHARDLVVLHDQKLVPFDARNFLQARYTILYFGAGWCPDCRKFSPALVAAYDQQPPTQRRFEVLFISQDHSQSEMQNFMAQEKMRWPALDYKQVSRAKDLAKYHANESVPWLAVIDQSGTVVLHSESDQDALEVLKQLQTKTASR